MSSIIHYTIAGNKSNSISIPMVRKEEQDHVVSSTSSAEWMVRIDDMTHSASKLFPKYCELFGWYAENSCQTNGTMGFWTPAKVLKHSEVVIIIPVAGFLAKLENAMNKKAALAQVEIIRIGENVPIQSILFETCVISSVQQELERAIIKMNITEKTNTIFDTSVDGSGGSYVSYVNYSTGTVEK